MSNSWMTDLVARRAGRVLLIVAMLATIGCDRLTKHVATTRLAGMPSASYFGDTVRLAYVENSGGFLSLGASLPAGARTAIFTVTTGLMLLILAVFAFRHRSSRWAAIGLVLVVAGGASNWIDRVVRGRVVDFLNVGIGPLRTGIFNVADVAIMLGVVVVALGELRRGRARRGVLNNGDVA